MGCMISLWTAPSDTGRKAFHPHRIDRVLIHLEVQEDLAFEGRGRLVGCVLVEVCLRGCACSYGRFTVLCELSIVNSFIRVGFCVRSMYEWVGNSLYLETPPVLPISRTTINHAGEWD